MRSSSIRRFAACLAFVFLAAFSGAATAAVTTPATSQQSLSPAALSAKTETSNVWLARTVPNTVLANAEECSSSSTPCCCRLGSTGTCTTAQDCTDNLGGKCVDSAPGCN